jgi:hypothetical protein
MKCFLSPDRQQKLTETLTSLGQEPDQIQRYLEQLPDDLEKVDEEMVLHVQCVVYCRAIDEPHEAIVGLAILVMIMVEAKSRGLAETDFPHSHRVIRDDLINHGITPPPETLQ